MTTKNRTVVLQAPQEVTKETASVEQFIVKAIEQGLPVETMERLFNLRKEVKAEQAKEAYVRAMSEFQAKCPVISKNKDVLDKNGKYRYSYASLDSIVSQVKAMLGECGLSYTTTVLNSNGFITAVCKITHSLGHSEESSFMIPIDNDAYMSAPQKFASALTFGKRYAFCNALGILTGEDDSDAGDVNNKSELQTVVSTKGKIMFLLKEIGVDTTVEKEVLFSEVKRLTDIDVKEDVETLNEIKSRLEVLLKEKRDANS